MGQHECKAYDPHFGVEYWAASTILNHPGFANARAEYVDKTLALYGDDAFLNKLLMEAARIVIFAVAICLAAGYREDDRSSWPTIGNLKKALALFGVSSPRRIESIVGRLVQTGYLESRVSPADARARLLYPTARMLAYDRAWLVAHYSPLAALFGKDDYTLPLGGDPDFQRVQRRIATGFFEQSAMVLLRNPGIMLFVSRDAGILVLMRLMQDAMKRGSPTVALSLSDLGRSFLVSRTHVRQLLADAEAQGLIDIDQRRRQVTLKPAIFESFDRFVADGMSNHDLTAAAARQQLIESAYNQQPGGAGTMGLQTPVPLDR